MGDHSVAAHYLSRLGIAQSRAAQLEHCAGKQYAADGRTCPLQCLSTSWRPHSANRSPGINGAAWLRSLNSQCFSCNLPGAGPVEPRCASTRIATTSVKATAQACVDPRRPLDRVASSNLPRTYQLGWWYCVRASVHVQCDRGSPASGGWPMQLSRRVPASESDGVKLKSNGMHGLTPS